MRIEVRQRRAAKHFPQIYGDQSAAQRREHIHSGVVETIDINEAARIDAALRQLGTTVEEVMRTGRLMEDEPQRVIEDGTYRVVEYPSAPQLAAPTEKPIAYSDTPETEVPQEQYEHWHTSSEHEMGTDMRGKVERFEDVKPAKPKQDNLINRSAPAENWPDRKRK